MLGDPHVRLYKAEFLMMSPEEEKHVDVLTTGNVATDNLLPEPSGDVLTLVGNRLSVSSKAPDGDAAYRSTLETATRFARLVSMKTGQHFTPVFQRLDSVPPEHGQAMVLLPLSWLEDSYDRADLGRDVAAAGAACSINDRVFDRALAYFQRGLFYQRVVWRLIHPLSLDGLFPASEATLNFYKAVVVILGDDPNGPRSLALQLTRDSRKRIDSLYTRRNHRDVAHPTLDVSAVDELEGMVDASRGIARGVIEAYANLLREGRSLAGLAPAQRRRPRSRR